MDALSVLALAAQCVTSAPAPVVASMAIAQTNGASYSVIIDDKHSVPADFDTAVQSAAIGLLNGSLVKVGITGISTTEFDKRNVAYSDGFSACRNMEITGDILRASWKRFGGQAEHWRLAVLETATGEPGIDGEFAQKYDAAMSEVQKATQSLPKEAALVSSTKPAIQADTPDGSSGVTQEKNTNSWDVYGRNNSQSVLVYSK